MLCKRWSTDVPEPGSGAVFPIVTCQSGSSNGFSNMAIPTMVTVGTLEYDITTYQVYAPMVEIRWQSSDLIANSTSASLSSTSTSSNVLRIRPNPES